MAHARVGISLSIVFISLFLGTTGRPSENDLNTREYLPFYGGAKGQYLEVTKDSTGAILKESIVQGDKIKTDNIVKNTDDNLISRVFGANIKTIHTLSGNLMNLHNKAKKIGFLENNKKELFKLQLNSFGETASNLIKLIDEIGGDVDMLFKKDLLKTQYNEDNVGEEGIGVDAPVDQVDGEDSIDIGEILSGASIADAKPFGLAVVGENGLAASRPVGTAVAASGVAIARPVATAIAGVDPAALGLNFQINPYEKRSNKQ